MKKNLIDLIAAQDAGNVPEAARRLAEALARQGNAASILYYGSGLWKESRTDTVHDFYVLADRFADFGLRSAHAFWGAVLPPHVSYMEITDEAGNRMRCKYALMRLDQFARAAKGRAVTPQIWARFAQPCRVLYARDAAAGDRAHEMLADCALTFLRHALRLAPAQVEIRQIWLAGLRATYAAELRAERPGRLEALYEGSKTELEQRTRAALSILSDVKRGDRFYRFLVTAVRPAQKLFALARLMKTAFTFQGAVDYALWKIGRQSGVYAVATDFQRRHPLIAGWPLLWRLWRSGALK